MIIIFCLLLSVSHWRICPVSPLTGGGLRRSRKDNICFSLFYLYVGLPIDRSSSHLFFCPLRWIRFFKVKMSRSLKKNKEKGILSNPLSHHSYVKTIILFSEWLSLTFSYRYTYLPTYSNARPAVIGQYGFWYMVEVLTSLGSLARNVKSCTPKGSR